MSDSAARFQDAMSEAGITPPSVIIGDGTIHRFHVAGDRSKNENGWYVFFDDENPAGQFGCWKRGISETWSGDEVRSLSAEGKARDAARMEAARKQRDEERQRIETECRKKSEGFWAKGRDVAADHPYIVKKGIKPIGARQMKDLLMIPVTDLDGNLHGLQFITAEGEKTFKTGTPKAGKCLKIAGKGKIVIVEGWATGVSIHQATGYCVIVAFDAGNLLHVARAVRAKWGKWPVIVACDNDQWTYGNPGLMKGTAAAREIGALLAVPIFTDTTTHPTDFNDLADLEGMERVKEIIEAAATVMAPQEITPISTPPAIVHEPGEGSQGEPQLPPFIASLRTGAELMTLEIPITWTVKGLLPEGAVTLFYARGGMGKTTLAMQMADAVSRGVPFFGLETIQAPVIVMDFENSLAVLSDRCKRISAEKVLFWDSGNRPPKLDKSEWQHYQKLVKHHPGAVLIFDTLRSSQGRDENDSQQMGEVMGRLRELRDLGATVMVLHHTTKAADTRYKGSSAIFDMADHILALYPVKKGTDQELEDECDDTEKVYRFGTKDKTRYAPFKIFLNFDQEAGLFCPALDPETEELVYLHGIISRIHRHSSANQRTVLDAIKADGGFDLPRERTLQLLRRGEGKYWRSKKGLRNATIYEPVHAGDISVSQFPDPYKGPETGKLKLSAPATMCEEETQSLAGCEFASSPDPPIKTEKLTDHPPIDYSASGKLKSGESEGEFFDLDGEEVAA